MATSGTVGATSVDVSAIIEHAFRRCGKLASTIPGELQLSAKENLFFLLSDLANRGTSLWCVEKRILGVIPSQTTFTLPVGTVDVRDAFYRTKTDLTGSTISGSGYSGLDLGSGLDEAVYTVSIMFTGSTTATMAIESSPDNATWTQRAAFPAAQTVAAGTRICADVDNSISARYWRVRDTSGTLPTVDTLTFSTTPVETPMTKLASNDFVRTPQKGFGSATGTKSLQYWYDKQTTPRIWVWPTTQGSVDQIVLWTQRHIQDVGALTNTLDIPQRWMESIILTLACRCALELPAGELPPGRLEFLEGKAAEHLTRAEAGESDHSPIRLAINIGAYSA